MWTLVIPHKEWDNTMPSFHVVIISAAQQIVLCFPQLFQCREKNKKKIIFAFQGHVQFLYFADLASGGFVYLIGYNSLNESLYYWYSMF